jgi:hypothetical protein
MRGNVKTCVEFLQFYVYDPIGVAGLPDWYLVNFKFI